MLYGSIYRTAELPTNMIKNIHYWNGYRLNGERINHLSKKKLYLSELKTHFVPRSKHSLLRF